MVGTRLVLETHGAPTRGVVKLCAVLREEIRDSKDRVHWPELAIAPERVCSLRLWWRSERRAVGGLSAHGRSFTLIRLRPDPLTSAGANACYRPSLHSVPP